MKYFKFYLPQGNSTVDQQTHIPKKIFMTWHSHQLSDEMYSNIQLWIKNNPDWELYLYDDQQVLEFLELNFEKDVVEAYNNIYPKAYKADLFRYCILYMYGGVYSDVKIVPLQPIANILSNDIDFISVKDRFLKGFEFDGYIYQAFLCSKPKHPFFKKAIQMIVENSQNNYYGNDPLSPTGPNLLGKAINICINKPCISRILPGKYQIQDFSYEILALKNHGIIDSNDKQFSLNSYPGYRNELYGDFELAKSYFICWFNDKCYIRSDFKTRFKSKYYSNKKELYFVDYLYITKNITKARWSAIKYCILKPILAQRIIKKVISYEKNIKSLMS
ncbi:glycosyltransferase family 32 protein [Francisella tularensis]|uniref:glycosyltransferase family 32 protein n=1 Tax=Francisella tularensis TaxID=263 RepID=UPI00018553EF|nr:glycosyltransferase [Francisella tularensis]EDZ90660.1 glycosyltransferase [Francisella tularensis subsp. novicida FTG]MBK2335385.1 mannosyltransferase [Francisella tularensis subsp. novicida]